MGATQRTKLSALHTHCGILAEEKQWRPNKLSYLFVNVGKNEIDLKHRTQQKFFWFVFASPADSCCWGKPARAAIHKRDWTRFDTTSHCHTALLMLSGHVSLSQCQSKNKLTNLWSPSEGQWALRSIFWREMRVEQNMVVTEESAGGWQGSTRDEWCQGSAAQLSPEWVSMTPAHASQNHRVHPSWKGSADHLIPAPCSKCAPGLISCRVWLQGKQLACWDPKGYLLL